jgi:hypothetical protein
VVATGVEYLLESGFGVTAGGSLGLGVSGGVLA